MTVNELSNILKEMYENAPSGEKTTMIRLFGVKYAEDIRGNGYTSESIF